MKQFEIGNVVTIRQWDDMQKEFGLSRTGSGSIYIPKVWFNFMPIMKQLCGKQFVIKEVQQDNVPVYKLARLGDKNNVLEFLFTANMFETHPNGIKRVLFADPATIIFWDDGTKTVVKCSENDTYSKEIGLAMCLAKKFLGNKGSYYEVFKNILEEGVV